MSTAVIEVNVSVPDKPGFYVKQYVDVRIEMSGSSWTWAIVDGGDIIERHGGHSNEKAAAEHAANHLDGEIVDTFQ